MYSAMKRKRAPAGKYGEIWGRGVGARARAKGGVAVSAGGGGRLGLGWMHKRTVGASLLERCGWFGLGLGLELGLGLGLVLTIPNPSPSPILTLTCGEQSAVESRHAVSGKDVPG